MAQNTTRTVDGDGNAIRAGDYGSGTSSRGSNESGAKSPVADSPTDVKIDEVLAGGGATMPIGVDPRTPTLFDDWGRQMRSMYDQNSGAAINPDNANANALRQQQLALIQSLQAQAAGSLDTRAQQQLKNSYNQALAQQASLGGSTRGQSAGAQIRGIQSAQNNIGRGMAGDQQMLKLQEQQAAQQLIAQLLNQQRGQDITQSDADAQAALMAQNIEDMRRLGYAGLGTNYELNRLDAFNQRQGALAGTNTQPGNARQSNTGLLNAGINAFGTANGAYNRTGAPVNSTPTATATSALPLKDWED